MVYMKEEIIKLEEELRLAMLTGNVDKLNSLISDSLIFIAPQGEIVTKQMDLDVQKNKIQKMSELIPSEQQIMVNDNCAIVTVKMKITGTFNNIDISGNYRYIRTWQNINNYWQIVSGAVIQLSK